MKNAIDAVIFDMDGLLLDTERVAFEAYMEAAGRVGVDAGEELFTSLIGKNWQTTTALVENALGERDGRRMLTAWPETFETHVHACGIPKKSGVDELLAMLEHRGVPIALATLTARDKTLMQLEAVGLADWFPTMATGDEVVNGKPAPDIFLLAAERLGADPVTSVALEDSEAGVQSASAAGMRVFMVPDLKQPTPEIEALTERVCTSLAEVRQFLEAILSGDSHH